ncbi:hypothetical protein J4216_02200 [Candidatus Woesearchaeota archaeon]|nr:hypothetical protein [Candidatus Woesearchaeota archaeon]
MKEIKKIRRKQLRTMEASFNQIFKTNYKKPDLTKCLKCKKEVGNNFTFAYKKNHELKGKLCLSCSDKY